VDGAGDVRGIIQRIEFEGFGSAERSCSSFLECSSGTRQSGSCEDQDSAIHEPVQRLQQAVAAEATMTSASPGNACG
jgi:hypothetical protein